MTEKRYSPWEEPRHVQNAQEFLNYVDYRIKPEFPSVIFSTTNVTDDTINIKHRAAKAVREERQFDYANELEKEGMEADIESATSTLIEVSMNSTVKDDLNKVSRLLTSRARELGVEMIYDFGPQKPKGKGFLEKLLDFGPNGEDLGKYKQLIRYKFI